MKLKCIYCKHKINKKQGSFVQLDYMLGARVDSDGVVRFPTFFEPPFKVAHLDCARAVPPNFIHYSEDCSFKVDYMRNTVSIEYPYHCYTGGV